jgi:hypothetical protein
MIDHISNYIIYLTVFRSLLILTGAMCIYLGYRLFQSTSQSSEKMKNDTSMKATIGKSKLVLKNAAPGTCFAAFGAFIIIAMIVASPPEMTFDQKNDSSEKTIQTSGTVRGAEHHLNLYDLTQKGVDYENKNDIQNAIKAYQSAVNCIANPINYLAWQYFQQNELDKALSMANIAVQISPDNANALDTLAQIHIKKGNKIEADRLMKKYNELKHVE